MGGRVPREKGETGVVGSLDPVLVLNEPIPDPGRNVVTTSFLRPTRNILYRKTGCLRKSIRVCRPENRNLTQELGYFGNRSGEAHSQRYRRVTEGKVNTVPGSVLTGL